jgi:hypothetical protein
MEVYIMTLNQAATHEQYQLKQGDPVIVKPDGWSWSDNERRLGFIIRLPDDALTNEGWAALVAPQVAGRVIEEGGPVEPVQLRQRWYTLDLDKVTPERKAEIVATDELKPISEDEFTIRDFIWKEAAAPRFRHNDVVQTSRI